MSEYIVKAYRKIDEHNFIIVAGLEDRLPIVDVLEFDCYEDASASVAEINAKIEAGEVYYSYPSMKKYQYVYAYAEWNV